MGQLVYMEGRMLLLFPFGTIKPIPAIVPPLPCYYINDQYCKQDYEEEQHDFSVPFSCPTLDRNIVTG